MRAHSRPSTEVQPPATHRRERSGEGMSGRALCLLGHVVQEHCLSRKTLRERKMQGNPRCGGSGCLNLILEIPPGPPSSFTCLAYFPKGTATCSLLVFPTDNGTIVWLWDIPRHGPGIRYRAGSRARTGGLYPERFRVRTEPCGSCSIGTLRTCLRNCVCFEPW